MTFDSNLLEWVERLTGLESERVFNALRSVTSWHFSCVDREILSQPSIDTAFAATFLSEAVDALEKVGVPRSKLLAKIRGDRDLWPTWAELRAAALLLKHCHPSCALQLEADRTRGSHSDFLLHLPGNRRVAVEFKAIGLSDEEARFCDRVAPVLDRLLPPAGLLTLHASLSVEAVCISDEQREGMFAESAKTAAAFGDLLTGLSGVAVIGHGAERNYARRLSLRLSKEVVRQAPPDAETWAAFLWTNGSPMDSPFIDSIARDLPASIGGIILVGDSVAFPDPRIHSFVSFIPRRGGREESLGPRILLSDTDEKAARIVLHRFETSSGVRSTRLASWSGPTPTNLLMRDGRRRILPFNLLLDIDPEHPSIPKRLLRQDVRKVP